MVPLAFVLMAVVSGEAQVGVHAAYVPAKGSGGAGVAVTFSPRDPDLRVNEEPAPRLKLDGGQQVLLDAAPSPRRPAGEKTKPGEIRYLDTALPVVFPVKLGAAAAKGEHSVKGAVTYFYCSKREGWCRKGTADVEIPVRID